MGKVPIAALRRVDTDTKEVVNVLSATNLEQAVWENPKRFPPT